MNIIQVWDPAFSAIIIKKNCDITVYNLLWYSKSNFIEVIENVVESQEIELCQLCFFIDIFLVNLNLSCSDCNST